MYSTWVSEVHICSGIIKHVHLNLLTHMRVLLRIPKIDANKTPH